MNAGRRAALELSAIRTEELIELLQDDINAEREARDATTSGEKTMAMAEAIADMEGAQSSFRSAIALLRSAQGRGTRG